MSELSDLNPGAPPLSGGDQPQGPDPMGDLRKLGANLGVANKAAEKPPVPTEFTQKADGSVTIKGDRQLMEYYGKAGQFYQQAMGGMQQQVDRLKQQETAARSQPAWVQLATALSANLAQQRDMPGWVKGMGQTAAQLNPRPEQLAAQRMGLMGEQADLAGKAATMELGVAREKRLVSYEEATMGMEQKKFGRQLVNDTLNREQTVNEKWDKYAVEGHFSPDNYAKELKAANRDISDEEIKALVVGKQELVKQGAELKAKLGTEKFNEFKKEQEVKFQNDVKMAELDHRNKMEELIAKNKGTINPKTGKPFTQFELKEIAEMETTGILVDNLVRDLDEHPDLFGPMPQTRARTWIKSFFDEGTSRVRADYAHALPIMVQLLREGTRGYARNQREWVESKVPQTTDTPERLKGKLAFMKGFLEARQAGLDKVFVTQDMARSQQMKGQSPYPAAPSHAAKPEDDVWTPEKVKALREKQSGGR